MEMTDRRDDRVPEGPLPASAADVRDPPRTLRGIVRHLGPGMILAGSIVGSGELILTTKTGAQAGFVLLWLIILGCVIKLFVQVEMGRYTVTSGRTAMEAINELPGLRWRVHWMLWYWLVMFVVSLAQLGGIVHGVGQALAMNVPLDGSFNRLLEAQDQWDEQARAVRRQLEEADAAAHGRPSQPGPNEAERQLAAEIQRRMGGPRPSPQAPGFFWTDDITWAAMITAVTVAILVTGRYLVIQHISTLLVAVFTAVTVFCVIGLQAHTDWMVHWRDLAAGLSFRLPPALRNVSPLSTALATFGIIGVGTNELISYPYWCLEKGYARFAGPRDATPDWARRALGWMWVMRWDVVVSTAVCTFATVAFYLLGAAVLHRGGLDPAASHMVRDLAEMYVPVFGDWARWTFLFGAFAVLYSTFFAANAGHTRVASDALRVFRVGARTERTRLWWIRAFSVFLPTFSLTTCVLYRDPVQLVVASGIMQAIMLPMLAGAALYYRYRRCDPRLRPGPLWDALLWVSAAGLLVAGAATAWLTLAKLW